MKTILNLLEDPESDNSELNARIWCWVRNNDIVSIESDGIQYTSTCNSKRDGVRTEVRLRKYPKNGVKNMSCAYTTSLDAAMSIGHEELEGWGIDIWERTSVIATIYSPLSQNEEVEFDTPRVGQLPTMSRAICHARCQALDHVRKEKP